MKSQKELRALRRQLADNALEVLEVLFHEERGRQMRLAAHILWDANLLHDKPDFMNPPEFCETVFAFNSSLDEALQKWDTVVGGSSLEEIAINLTPTFHDW